MEDVINERRIHYTRNYYITAPNVFSMERQTLINEIDSIFHNLCDSKRKCDLKLFFGFHFISIKTLAVIAK